LVGAQLDESASERSRATVYRKVRVQSPRFSAGCGNISDQEIREAGRKAEIIEDYPYDKFSASALLLGFTTTKRPLHFQVSLMDAPLVKIITIYEPNPNEWTRYKQRR
jgi:hypothetical protein